MNPNPLSNLTPIQLQILATLGPVIGFLAGYIAAWTGIDQASATGMVMALIIAALTAYNGWVSRKTAQVTSVANLPEVKNVILDASKPGATKLEDVTPDNVVKQ